MRLSPFIFIALTSSLLLGCGSSVETDGTSGSTEPPPEDDVQCPEPGAAGAFTFRVRNDRATDLALFFGCGGNPPIQLSTSEGVRGIGPESVDFCGFSCEPILAGMAPPTGCSDCGPGVSQALPQGATVEIPWDRRVWKSSRVPAACSKLDEDHECALAVAVETTQIEGSLTFCASELMGPGFCPDEQRIDFTADLTQDAVEIVIQ